MCMLLWSYMMKEAKMDEESKRKLDRCIAASAPQGTRLKILEQILQQGIVDYRHWNRQNFADWNCNKKFASVIFVTDKLICASLPHDGASTQSWHRRVMKDWEDNNESAYQILKRMNRFLQSLAETSQIIKHVIPTQSYVCYMKMPKVTCHIFFGGQERVEYVSYLRRLLLVRFKLLQVVRSAEDQSSTAASDQVKP